jgi:methanogenic corrinoid protein MtbC1
MLRMLPRKKDKSNKDICEICKKNKATMNYADGFMEYTHGFIQRICRGCYNKKMESNTWYKQGVEDGKKEVKSQERKRIIEMVYYMFGRRIGEQLEHLLTIDLPKQDIDKTKITKTKVIKSKDGGSVTRRQSRFRW